MSQLARRRLTALEVSKNRAMIADAERLVAGRRGITVVPPPSGVINFRSDYDPDNWSHITPVGTWTVAPTMDGFAARQGGNFARYRNNYDSGDGTSRVLGNWYGFSSGVPLDAQPGTTHWYGFSFLLPSQTFPTPGSGFFIFHEIHAAARVPGHEDAGGVQAPVHFKCWSTTGLRFELRSGQITVVAGPSLAYEYNNGVNLWNPVVFGTWVDFVLEWRYSTTWDGYIRCWRRVGNEPSYTFVFEWLNVPTMQRMPDGSISGHYWSQGIYTPYPFAAQTVYLDGFRRGTTFEVVANDY